jgi:hypothetical protein
MNLTLSCAVTTIAFAAGTTDTPWAFHVSGTQADGTPFGGGVESPNSTTSIDLPPGTYTLVVEKNGVSSLPSDPFTVGGMPGGGTTEVELSVPDATQKAVIVPPQPAS